MSNDFLRYAIRSPVRLNYGGAFGKMRWKWYAVVRVISTLLLVGIAGMVRLAPAAPPDTQPMSIPAEDLGTTLFRLAQLTHQQIAFDYKAVQGYKSGALAGAYTAADTLPS